MTEKMKDALSFIGRVAISFGLLFWLFKMVNWRDTVEAIRQADPVLIGWAFAIHIFLQFAVLMRWFIFMKALNFKAPIGQVCRYFFIGLFCNLFLPTSIGGDLVKAYGLSRGAGQKPKVYASVVLDRLSGFAGLVVVALVAYFIGGKIIDAPSVIVPIALLTALSLAVGGMLFNKPVYNFFCRVFLKMPRFHKALMDMHADVLLMRGKKRTGIGCIFFSCGVQILSAYMYYLIALALHQQVHLLHFLIFTPIIAAVSFLPSIGGLGFREGGWVYLLGKVGISGGIAMSLSLIGFLFVILVGLAGGVIYVTSFSDRRLQRDPQDAGAGPAGRKHAGK
ncbi:MAG: flippase-like domain-containing protein [Candidatus Omnitrophica bacterium]|nr:flippase-like domain-containing protein [Candidatus Omnitrophota bacterium]